MAARRSCTGILPSREALTGVLAVTSIRVLLLPDEELTDRIHQELDKRLKTGDLNWTLIIAVCGSRSEVSVIMIRRLGFRWAEGA